MKVRKLHRVLGIVLLLPFLGWAATGFVFFLKPGYAGAYESLPVRTYPLSGPCAVRPAEGWLEVRCLRTVLGPHLLARTGEGWQQLDPLAPENGQPRPRPTEAEIRLLLEDAFRANPQRYGSL